MTLYYAREQVRQRYRLYYSPLVISFDAADRLVEILRISGQGCVEALLSDSSVFIFEVPVVLGGYHDIVAGDESESVPALLGMRLTGCSLSVVDYLYDGPNDPGVSVRLCENNIDRFELRVRALRPSTVVTVFGVGRGSEPSLEATTETPNLDPIHVDYSYLAARTRLRTVFPETPDDEGNWYVRQRTSRVWKLAAAFVLMYVIFSVIGDVRRVEPWDQWDQLREWLQDQWQEHRSGFERVAQVVGAVLSIMILGVFGFGFVIMVVGAVAAVFKKVIYPRLSRGRLFAALEQGPVLSTVERGQLDPRLSALLLRAFQGH